MTINVTGEDFENPLIYSQLFDDDEWERAFECWKDISWRSPGEPWERTTVTFSIYEGDDLLDEVLLYEIKQ